MRLPRLNRKTARRAAGLLATIIFIIIAACQPGKRITKANVDHVAEGMAKKQVESILGMPTTVEALELGAGLKQTTYVYTQGADHVTIVFREDKVVSKETTLAE